MSGWKTREIICIVNGENVIVRVADNDTVAVLRERVLRQSYNTCRPLDEWEVRDERGAFIAPEDKVAGLGLDGARLFVTLKVACGGVK